MEYINLIQENNSLKDMLKKRDQEIKHLQEELSLLRTNLGCENIHDNYREIERLHINNADELQLNKHCLSRQLLETIPVQIYIKDNQNRYMYLNQSALQRMNANIEEIRGTTTEESVDHKELARNVLEEDNRTIGLKRHTTSIEHWTDNHGHYRTNRTVRYPILVNDETVVGVVSVASDESFTSAINTTSAMVELLVHDWVAELLEVLHDNLQNLLASKSRSPKYSADERAHAKKLLEISREGDLHPIEIDENYSEMTFNGWVGKTFMPIHFMEGYLRFLRWYLGDPDFINQNRIVLAKMNLKVAVCEYMDCICEFLRGENSSTNSENGNPSWLFKHDGVPNDMVIVADSRTLRMLFFEMIRNHNKYGKTISESGTKYPLEISAKRLNKNTIEMRFKSKGKPIEDEYKKLIWERGERGKQSDDPRRRTPGSGFGLFFCSRIAGIHYGDRYVESYDDETFRGNIFVFRIKEKSDG